MIQDAQVGWDPAYEHHAPLGTKLFFLYLLFVIAIWVVRSVSVIRQLWLLKGQIAKPESAIDFSQVRGACAAKVRAMRRSAVLTLFVSVFTTAWHASETFMGFSVEKVTAPAFVWGSMAEIARDFTIGILVCVVIYAVAVLFEGILVRRFHRIEQARS